MIEGIFYARFLPQEGTKIVAQSPPGCIVAPPDTPNLKPPLLDFDIIQEYVIPRKAFFNRFITVNSPDDKYSVLGFPVSIPNERYHRNEFLFNFGLVVESDVDQIPYERLVRRLAVIFAEMERQNGYLSSEGTAKAAEDGRRPIESLLEIIKEDLNNYGECMIPIDEASTLNMKLFPHQAAPAAVRGWHVPVPKMKLADIVDPTWDLTLQKIIPHVDGVNDVRRVAWLADVSLPLAQVALRHLLYYDTVLLLDMFFFGSCYAPRPGVHDFVANRDGLVDECAAYVCLRPPSSPPPPPPPHSGGSGGGGGGGGSGTGDKAEDAEIKSGEGQSTISSSSSHPHGNDGDKSTPTTKATTTTTKGKALLPPSTAGTTSATGTETGVTHYQLIKLMTTFCAGRSVMEWVKLHRDAGGFDVLRHVDVRRLVQFGVIKGLLYRVHKYVVSKRYLAQLATGQVQPKPNSSSSRRRGRVSASHHHASSHNPPPPPPHHHRAENTTTTTTIDENNSTGKTMKPQKKKKKKKKSGGRAGITGPGARNIISSGNKVRDDDGRGGKGGEAGGGGGAGRRSGNADAADSNPLRKYLDGTHCFDEIITEQNTTDAEIMEKLKSFQAPAGDLTVFYR